MVALRHMSIGTKLVVLATCSSMLALLLAILGFVGNDMQLFQEAEREHISSHADILAFHSVDVLCRGDKKEAAALLAAMRTQDNIVLATLYDANDAPLACYAASSAPSIHDVSRTKRPPGFYKTAAGQIDLVKHVVNKGEHVGTLEMRARLTSFQRQWQSYVLIVGLLLGSSFAFAMAFSFVLRKGITIPLKSLADTAARIAHEGDYSLRVPVTSKNEFGQLCKTFNEMLDRVQSSDAALKAAHDELELRVTSRTADLREELTQRERIQRDLVQARDAAHAANRAKSAFLANMSHEIRTPLNGILGFTSLMRMEGADGDHEECRDYLETIHRCGEHLLLLVNDILDLSKIEAGHMTVEALECSPQTLLADVLSVLRVKALSKGISLDAEWTTAIPQSVTTDPARLRQVLINLVGNAIKFTERGYVRIVAALLDAETSPRLEFRVIDTGSGIAPDKLESIFEPFTQADVSVTRKFGGTGLGLTISRRIARALGGDLVCTSELGKGSEFKVTVNPGEMRDVSFISHCDDEFAIRPTPPKIECNGRLPACSLLLVEDGETNRKFFRLVLERAGAQVMCAENGEIGVRMALEHDFDVILMDMQMPILDGSTATRRLRTAGLSVPIIALTAHAFDDDKRRCLEAGCDAYLSKPVTGQDLVAQVKANLRCNDEELKFSSPHAEVATRASTDPAFPDESGSDGNQIASTLPSEDEEFNDIVEGFLDSLELRMGEMELALSQADFTEIYRLAHWLKGSGGSIGFPCLTPIAIRLEQQAEVAALEEIRATLFALRKLTQRFLRPSQIYRTSAAVLVVGRPHASS